MPCPFRPLGFSLLLATLALAPATRAEPGGLPLTMNDYLRRVVEENETIAAQLLGTEAARQRLRAEYGAFEPQIVASAEKERNKRPNTTQQQRNLSGVNLLNERNNLFNLGLEGVTNTGAKVRLGYTLSNYHNNLRRIRNDNDLDINSRRGTDEWQSFAGLTVTQPLLRNGGPTAALANLRLAALNSETAFQEYRRQMMVTLSQAQSAYWGVHFAQEQLTFLNESVKLTESILADARKRSEIGAGSELDVLEAEAGLALRRTKRNEASQRYEEAMGQMLLLSGTSPLQDKARYRVVDRPSASIKSPAYQESYVRALGLNPDYLIQKKKLDEAQLRLGIAKNLALPELNLSGSFGYNALDGSAGGSIAEVGSLTFPSYSVGLELRVPIGGNIQGDRNRLAAALTVGQLQLQVQAMEKQIATSLDTALNKIKASRESSQDYETMIRFNENLLRSERDRLSVGKVDGRRVLEVEAGLFEVRQGLVDARVQQERAALELYLAEGSVLERRHLDFTAADLRVRTVEKVYKPAPAHRLHLPQLPLRPLPDNGRQVTARDYEIPPPESPLP